MTISEFFAVSADSLITGKEEPPRQKEPPVYTAPLTRGWGRYEYKSKRTLWGLPLVHINLGCGLYKSKGIISVGILSRGIVSLGVLSMGVLSFGAISLGLFVIAGLSLGLFAIGGIAVGVVAIAGAAFGVFALGGIAVGVSSVGGIAVGSHIGIGGYARAPVSVGEIANGVEMIKVQHADGVMSVSKADILSAVHKVFPDIWKPLTDWATMFFH